MRASNWSVILRDLPPATHARVRTAVEAARAAYFAAGDAEASAEQECLWRGIANYAGGKQTQGFFDLVAQLPPEEALELRSTVRDLTRLHKKARTRVARFQQQGRRAKFYRAVLRAWSDARVLGQTETGPTARFLCAVSEGVSLHLTGRGAKEIIKREQERRRTLERLEQKYPIINAAATFDEAAQRRANEIDWDKYWETLANELDELSSLLRQ